MEFRTLISQIDALASLTERWQREGAVGTLERDLALEKLRALYERIATLQVGQPARQPAQGAEEGASVATGACSPASAAQDEPAPMRAQQSEEPDVEVELIFAQDLKVDEAPGTEPGAARPQPQDEPDSAQAQQSDEPDVEVELIFAQDLQADGAPGTEPGATRPQPQDEPDSVQAQQPEEPDVEVELIFAQDLQADKAPGTEPGAALAAQDEPAPMRAQQPLPGEPGTPPQCAEEQAATSPPTPAESDGSVAAPHPQAQPAAPSDDADRAAEQRIAQQQLFDMEQLQSRRDRSRRIILSLYGEADVPQQPEQPRNAQAETPSGPAAEAGPSSATREAHGQQPAAETPSGLAADAGPGSGAPAREGRQAGPAASPAQADPGDAITEAAPALVQAGEGEPDAAPPAQSPPHRTAIADMPRTQVLGEVLGADTRTLGEQIAPHHSDLASRIARQEAVSDLRSALGINDRFLVIRDLFSGDSAAYERAIDELNAFDDLDECLIHIAEHYRWNPNCDGARLLVELLERKLQ